MEILSVGYDFRHGPDFKLLRPNGLNEYLLLIIRSKAVFEINENQFKLSPGSMILINKNTPHSFYADNEIFINDWIAFDLNAEEYNMVKSSIKINMFFNSVDIEFCSHIINLMQDEVKYAGINKNININLFLNIILNKLKKEALALNFDKKYYKELEKIRNEIYLSPQKEYRIEELSSRVNLSKSYFQYLYKLYFNKTPISDVIISRIEYSKQLLTSTGYSIAEIAELCGYKDTAQFIKQFKAITKTTPRKYMARCRNEICRKM